MSSGIPDEESAFLKEYAADIIDRAVDGFVKHGRGALMCVPDTGGTPNPPIPARGNLPAFTNIVYLPLEGVRRIQSLANKDLLEQLIADYDPDEQFVIVIPRRTGSFAVYKISRVALL